MRLSALLVFTSQKAGEEAPADQTGRPAFVGFVSSGRGGGIVGGGCGRRGDHPLDLRPRHSAWASPRGRTTTTAVRGGGGTHPGGSSSPNGNPSFAGVVACASAAAAAGVAVAVTVVAVVAAVIASVAEAEG